MRCHTAQKLVIAAVDGELAGWRHRRLDRHLAGCERCRLARVSSERLLNAVGGLAFEAPMPARLEQDVLRAVRKAAAAEEESAWSFGWLRTGVPVLAAGAVALLALVLVRGPLEPAGAPEAAAPGGRVVAHGSLPVPAERLAARKTRTRVPADPPAALAARPELFMDLPILRNLDKLQHFDAIATTDVDEGGAPDDGGAPSNG